MLGAATLELRSKLCHNAVMRYVAKSVGVDLYSQTEDRRLLAEVILPYFRQHAAYSRILFVGCDWYTRSYGTLFDAQEFWTLDFDPEKARYGGDRHVTACVTTIDRLFGRGELDAIVCNGVFGWGLDERNDVEKAFWGFRRVMRPGGIFVLGWNDLPERTPFPLEEAPSLRAFRRYDFPPLGASRVLTATPYRHTYDFYLR